MGLSSSSFPYLPLWLFGVLFLAALIVAREIGKFIRDRIPRGDDAKDDTFAMTSVLGLLALLIGFTFSIALSRYDARRELVVNEANAIGTTWLRADLMEAADRDRMRDVLRRYVDARIAFGNARSADEEVANYQQTEALQSELWSTMLAGIASFRDTERASLIVSTTNDAIDVAATRFTARQSHIPPRILRMLGMFALLAAGMVGFERGEQRRATTILFVLLTLAVTLVIDLDRPSTGMTNVSQEPMLHLRASMAPASPAIVAPTNPTSD
ncbi:hypothetical protein [Lysobacter auxotrophicus]|uniref:DUF4239 domain-containing protein n=1 Tax=Lysobacter auxotrophicus TaxID=2992573 RepID=A0ABM8DDN1_9GAMM|nr:hypothetical protein [Lysobacter auxotrophicus]BDU16689.1 DUF4239 domain-containing protein [Lysobacter auxotrophicus]